MPPPKKTASADPVESAKIASPPPAPAPVAKAAPPPLPAPVVVKASAERYRVKARTTISLFGQIVVLPADAIITAENYGPDGMVRILESGAPLEKLE